MNYWKILHNILILFKKDLNHVFINKDYIIIIKTDKLLR